MSERIEKVLAQELNISRSRAKALLRQKQVTLNGKTVTAGSAQFEPGRDVLVCGGKEINYRQYVYIMMNKPKGVISASDGKGMKTVIDILPEEMRRKNLFPAGRLDKDTTGFVLITDDGAFAHKILSPSNHVPKTYIAGLSAPFDDEVKKAFESGMEMDGKTLLSASLEAVGGDRRKAKVVIRQGLYHQIKRMFARFSIKVETLQRIQMGSVPLDSSLPPCGCRYLTDEEVQSLSK